jgi:hypothetical protein
MQTPVNTLTYDQFQVSLANASQQFSLLRKKYPELKAYLVLSLLGKQINLDLSPKDILSAFPTMVVDDEAKSHMLSFLKKPLKNDASEAEKERWKKQAHELSLNLKYAGNIQFEMRFNSLNYDLIWKLQSDELVDRCLTPQTKASINIVLGTISHFAGIED